MLTEVVPEQLQSASLFRGLSSDEIGQMLDRCDTVHYQPGEMILRSGDRERAIYMLIQGTIEVVLDLPGWEESVISTLDSSGVFGEASFFHAAPHAASVRSVTEATLVRLRRADFDALLGEDSRAAYRLAVNAAEILASRLHTTDQWVAQLLADQRTVIAASWRHFREGLGVSFDFPHGFSHVT